MILSGIGSIDESTKSPWHVLPFEVNYVYVLISRYKYTINTSGWFMKQMRHRRHRVYWGISLSSVYVSSFFLLLLFDNNFGDIIAGLLILGAGAFMAAAAVALIATIKARPGHKKHRAVTHCRPNANQ